MDKLPRTVTLEVGMSSQSPSPVIARFKRDLGIRATLALLALIFYELMIAAGLVMMFIGGKLDVTTTLAILGLAQTPAMLAMNAYFNLRANTPTDQAK